MFFINYMDKGTSDKKEGQPVKAIICDGVEFSFMDEDLEGKTINFGTLLTFTNQEAAFNTAITKGYIVYCTFDQCLYMSVESEDSVRGQSIAGASVSVKEDTTLEGVFKKAAHGKIMKFQVLRPIETAIFTLRTHEMDEETEYELPAGWDCIFHSTNGQKESHIFHFEYAIRGSWDGTTLLQSAGKATYNALTQEIFFNPTHHTKWMRKMIVEKAKEKERAVFYPFLNEIIPALEEIHLKSGRITSYLPPFESTFQKIASKLDEENAILNPRSDEGRKMIRQIFLWILEETGIKLSQDGMYDEPMERVRELIGLFGNKTIVERVKREFIQAAQTGNAKKFKSFIYEYFKVRRVRESSEK